MSNVISAAATSLPTRRAALASLAGLAAISLPRGPQASDPLPAIYAEKRRVSDLLNAAHYTSEAESDALMDRWGACDAAVMACPATTPAGALASIKWARTELLEFGFDASDTDKGSRLVLALLDGAVGVLRGIGGAL